MAIRIYKTNNFATVEYDPGETISLPLQDSYVAAQDGTINSISRVKIIANASPTAPAGNTFLSGYPWYSIKNRTGATAATGPSTVVDYLNDIFGDPIEITDFVKPDTTSGKSETTQFVHNGDLSAGGALVLDTDGAKIGFQDNTYINIEEDNTYGAGYGTLTINLENGGSTQNFLTAQMGSVYSQAVTTVNVGTLTVNGDTSFTSDVELGNAAADTITVNGTLVGVDIEDLDNVTVATPAGGQILEYDSATSEWVNVYADHSYVRVYNNTASAMSRGDVVYVNGAQNSNVAQVGLAQANSSSTMPAIGVLLDDLAIGSEGLAVVGGKANGVALPSASFSEGDVVYVSATTAGGVTATKPTGTNLIQNLGIVMQTHDTNGTIKVTGVGRTNDIPNIPNGQVWIGNASGVATPTTLETVATSGDYNDLTNTPTTITASQASAITANTAKVGITTQQASDISANNAKVSYTDASAVAANTAKVTFPGFGTSGGTALEGDTALLQLGTTSSTALAGDTITITSGQASAITANTAKTGITSGQASAITANTAKVTFPGFGTSAGTALEGNTAIPTATSDLTNDSGFITAANELDGIYLKVETRDTAYANDSYEGEILKWGNASSMSAGQLRYMSAAGSPLASRWVNADADAESTTAGMLGIALGSSATTNGMFIKGVIAFSNSFDPGDTLYVSLTAGGITNDISSYTTGDIVRIVGYAMSTGLIYFNPSDDYIELS